jgi:hypothetical protein
LDGGRFASKSGFDPIVLIDEEGVGETSGQRPDRALEKRSRFTTESPAEETGFLRSCGCPTVRNFTHRFAADVRSGPDVFADALVPAPERAPSGYHFQRHRCFVQCLAASKAGPAHCADG